MLSRITVREVYVSTTAIINNVLFVVSLRQLYPKLLSLTNIGRLAVRLVYNHTLVKNC